MIPLVLDESAPLLSSPPLCYTSPMFVSPASLLGARAVARFRPGGWTLFIAGSAALGVGLVLAREFSYGPGLGADSAIYVEVARNLLAGEFFRQLYGEPFIYQPPLYPALLAAASLPLDDPKDVIAPLNAAVTGATIIVVGIWLRRRIESRFVAAWGVLAVACSHPVVWAGTIGFPLALLILLTMAALINADNYFRDGRRASLVCASVFSALACLTHYTGIAVVIAVAVLLVARPDAALNARTKRAISYAVSGSAPLVLWHLLAIYRTGELLPATRGVTYSLLGLMGDIATATSKWAFVNLFVDSLYGGGVKWAVASALSGAALSVLAVGVGLGVVRASFKQSAGHRIWGRWDALFLFGGFALTFLFLYLAALMMDRTWNGVQDRHLVPAYLPLLASAAFALDGLFVRRAGGNERFFSAAGLSVRRAPSTIAMAAMGLWLAFALALHPIAIAEANAYGIANGAGQYGRSRYADSETIRYVSDRVPAADVYSNDALALSLYVPRIPSPRPFPHRMEDLPGWIKAAPDGASIVWLHALGGLPNYAAPDLRATPGLEVVAELADGVVFIVNKAHNPQPARQAAYNAVTAREPAVRSVYDVYLDERTLTYAKEPCAREETVARFFLHVVPVDLNDLPEDRKSWEFDNLDFSFEFDGVRLGDACMVSASLSAYPIAEIETGQFDGGGRLWDSEFRFPQ